MKRDLLHLDNQNTIYQLEKPRRCYDNKVILILIHLVNRMNQKIPKNNWQTSLRADPIGICPEDVETT